MIEQRKSTAPINYDELMQANLTRVFGERDAVRRMQAIRELYAEDAAVHEPHASSHGHVAICDAVAELLSHLPPGIVFRAAGPAVGHHGVGLLRWRSGAADGAAGVTGTDVAHVEAGLIQSLHVFLDPTGA